MADNGRHWEKLRGTLEAAYTLDELATLTYDLHIDYENLEGITKSAKVTALIGRACRLKQLDQLKTKLETDWQAINWDAVCPNTAPAGLDETPPYQGLNYFDVGDTGRYFGRDQLITDLINRINDEKLNFLMVVGASGSGKSSLVRAGLIPTLQGNRP